MPLLKRKKQVKEKLKEKDKNTIHAANKNVAEPQQQQQQQQKQLKAPSPTKPRRPSTPLPPRSPNPVVDTCITQESVFRSSTSYNTNNNNNQTTSNDNDNSSITTYSISPPQNIAFPSKALLKNDDDGSTMYYKGSFAASSSSLTIGSDFNYHPHQSEPDQKQIALYNNGPRNPWLQDSANYAAEQQEENKETNSSAAYSANLMNRLRRLSSSTVSTSSPSNSRHLFTRNRSISSASATYVEVRSHRNNRNKQRQQHARNSSIASLKLELEHHLNSRPSRNDTIDPFIPSPSSIKETITLPDVAGDNHQSQNHANYHDYEHGQDQDQDQSQNEDRGQDQNSLIFHDYNNENDNKSILFDSLSIESPGQPSIHETSILDSLQESSFDSDVEDESVQNSARKENYGEDDYDYDDEEPGLGQDHDEVQVLVEQLQEPLVESSDNKPYLNQVEQSDLHEYEYENQATSLPQEPKNELDHAKPTPTGTSDTDTSLLASKQPPQSSHVNHEESISQTSFSLPITGTYKLHPYQKSPYQSLESYIQNTSPLLASPANFVYYSVFLVAPIFVIRNLFSVFTSYR